MIHPTAEVSPEAQIGEGTKIWHQAQVREGARLGANCIVAKGVYIDFDVIIGNNVKIQNGASIYHGVTIEDGVFIGPHACLTNDKTPRAITPSGELKGSADWAVGKILVKYGASVGAGAVVLPQVTIGRFAMVGAGAVVTKDVPDQGLVVGNPARLVGYVCKCGRKVREKEQGSKGAEERRGRGAREQGSRGAGEQGSRGAEERRSGGAGERVVLWCQRCWEEVEVRRADWERVR